jgi:hypothetical protein
VVSKSRFKKIRSDQTVNQFFFAWLESEGEGPRGKASRAIRPVRRTISQVGGEICPIRRPICSNALEFVCSAQVLTAEGDVG